MRRVILGVVVIAGGFAVLLAYGKTGSNGATARGLIERGFSEGVLHGVCVVTRGGDKPVVVHSGRCDETVGGEGSAIGMDSRFRIASLTKVLVQIAFLRLVEESRVDLDGALSVYRPGLGAAWADEITIRQLLTFRAGLARERSGASGPVDGGVRYDSERRAVGYLDGLVDDGPVVEPGTRTEYSNLGYMHLGGVLEEVCGGSVEDAMRELVFAPAGMTDTGLFGADELDGEMHVLGHRRLDGGGFAAVDDIPISVRYTAGGFYSTARDLERLSLALLGGTLLEPSSVELLMNGFGREDDGRVHAAGLVPGFANVWSISADSGLVVISLNNAVGGSPKQIVGVVDEIVALYAPSGKGVSGRKAHEKRLGDEGWIRIERAEQIPERAILGAALEYLEVVESLDESAIFEAALAIRQLDRSSLDEDDIGMYRWLAMYQAELYRRQGLFELVAWREGEAGALQMYCAGPEGRALRFTFIPAEGEGSRVSGVKVATMGFDPDPDLFESGGPNKIEKR